MRELKKVLEKPLLQLMYLLQSIHDNAGTLQRNAVEVNEISDYVGNINDKYNP